MPLKNNHGLYGTIMSAMPAGIKLEVARHCELMGFKKNIFIIRVFGGYDSGRILSAWFQAMWARYISGNNMRVCDIEFSTRQRHYNKVVKMIPENIKREANIFAASHGLRKIAVIENAFGDYNMSNIVDAWFRMIWKNAISSN
ncbi:MAG: hypothetical protein HZC28_08555 [Spirochaetes bacterium]|nr:hypothetical protein [Spirochaetota bacterium]